MVQGTRRSGATLPTAKCNEPSIGFIADESEGGEEPMLEKECACTYPNSVVCTRALFLQQGATHPIGRPQEPTPMIEVYVMSPGHVRLTYNCGKWCGIRNTMECSKHLSQTFLRKLIYV